MVDNNEILYLLIFNTFPKEMWIKDGINAEYVFRDVPKLFRGIRRLWFILGLPLRKIWYGPWYKHRSNYQYYVYEGSILTRFIPIDAKHNDNVKFANWIWAPINENSWNKIKYKGNFSIWSYFIYDCKKYNLKFNHQYYFKNAIIEAVPEKHVYYIGQEKNRGKDLNKLIKYFDQNNISYNFNIVNSSINKELPKEFYSDFVSYDDSIKEMSKCKAVLELVGDNNESITLRPMEALFQKKKLITDNKAIKKEDFYNPRNIFVLGEDSISDLKHFLHMSYDDTNYEKFVNKYCAKTWISKFF